MVGFISVIGGHYYEGDRQPGDIEGVRPLPTGQQQRETLQVQIDQIEAQTHMNRFVREAMLIISVQQAATLGLTEPQLYAANIGYKKVKDIDTQIVILRTQMEAIV